MTISKSMERPLINFESVEKRTSSPRLSTNASPRTSGPSVASRSRLITPELLQSPSMISHGWSPTR